MKVLFILPLVLVSILSSTTSASTPREISSPTSRHDSIAGKDEKITSKNALFPKRPRKRIKWLSSRRFSFLKGGKFSVVALKAATCCQYGLLAYLVVGVFKDIVKAVRDINEASSDDNSQNALSRHEVKNLIAWISEIPDGSLPMPSISLPWLVPITLNLYSQAGMSRYRLEHILRRLTMDQANILHDCLLESDQKICLESVGGLAAIKQSISEWISFNCNPQQRTITPYDNFLNSGRQGLALWGPPGCGKSLLMKAIANKSRLPTLVVTPSLMQHKYYGESTKRVRSLFSLISLLGPCVVILDELDGLFKSRNADEIEVSRDLKTEWFQWWDGVASDQINNPKVLFVSATNRPWDCDPAVWRRLPQRHYVGVPTYDDRLNLFHVLSNKFKLPPIENEVLEYFAGHTEGYIPSDLYHILQIACRKGPMERLDETLTMNDVHQALIEIPPTRFTMEYVQQVQGFLAPNGQAQQDNSNGSTAANGNGGSYFETSSGRYYQFQIPVDTDVDEMLRNQNHGDDSFDSFTDSDDSTDSDFDDL